MAYIFGITKKFNDSPIFKNVNSMLAYPSSKYLADLHNLNNSVKPKARNKSNHVLPKNNTIINYMYKVCIEFVKFERKITRWFT